VGNEAVGQAPAYRTTAYRTPARWALAALAALTLLRLVVAATAPLAPDEAYYWVWSRALAAGYPDHPPMVALWIRLGTSLAGDGPLGIRLLGPLSVAVASLLLADAAERLLPNRNAGLHAAVMLNATLLFGVGAVMMTPDAPLLVFWTACLWALARVPRHSRESGGSLGAGFGWWLAVGLFGGLAMASKYTAALLWFGIMLWLLVTPSMRTWLRAPAPWLGKVLGGAIFLPTLIWNADHGWTSFVRQGGRLGDWHPGNAFRFLGELIIGQIGLVTPLIFAFCVGGIVIAARRAWRTRDPAWTLLAVMTLPGAVLFMQHVLGDRVQGNWPAVIYPAAAIAAGGLTSIVWQRLWLPSVALGFAITLLVYLHATIAPLPVPIRFDPSVLQLAGWNTLAEQVDAIRQREGATYVAADQYGVAAELARDLPPGVMTVGVEPRWALFNLPRASLAGRVGILVTTNRLDSNAAPWSSITPNGTAARERGTEAVETYRLYRVTAASDPADAVVLPRPDH
jgi:4-amino-4-deoxy-L-arabinose transferase-like glycosyltransferase